MEESTKESACVSLCVSFFLCAQLLRILVLSLYDLNDMKSIYHGIRDSEHRVLHTQTAN